MIITLDGPAGAGKSSAARALASRLGWSYIDTGAMYRAVAFIAIEQGIPLEDAPQLARLVEKIRIVFTNGRVLVEDRDVSAEIRTERITAATRPVADAPPVREAMKHAQRRMAQGSNVVTEGRDQGTVVFPHADLKVFLTASPVERAQRRQVEELTRGNATTVESILESHSRRDEADRLRPVGALRPADNAVLLETDGLTCEEVVEHLIILIEAQRKAQARE